MVTVDEVELLPVVETVGASLGLAVGCTEGLVVGDVEGLVVGSEGGALVGATGLAVGDDPFLPIFPLVGALVFLTFLTFFVDFSDLADLVSATTGSGAGSGTSTTSGSSETTFFGLLLRRIKSRVPSSSVEREETCFDNSSSTEPAAEGTTTRESANRARANSFV